MQVVLSCELLCCVAFASVCRYRLLPSLSARYQFLSTVQFQLLKDYREWIDAAAKAGLKLMQHVCCVGVGLQLQLHQPLSSLSLDISS